MAENKVGAPDRGKPLVRPPGESPARRPGQPGSADENRATAHEPRHVPSHSPRTGTDDTPLHEKEAVEHGDSDDARG